MNIFYLPDVLIQNYLSEEESRHASKVLRLRKDDTICIYDGEGIEFTAVIKDTNPKRVLFEIIEKKINKKNHSYHLHIAIAPTKNIDRFEYFLEKSTEIGIDEITPLYCEHSERKNINMERIQKILVSSIKQSQNPFLPLMNPMVNIKNFLSSEKCENKFIAHCYDYSVPNLKNIYKKNSDAIILIGPEGDFSSSEIELAKLNSFIEINLGPNRLRTETAGIVTCHTINLLNQ